MWCYIICNFQPKKIIFLQNLEFTSFSVLNFYNVNRRFLCCLWLDINKMHVTVSLHYATNRRLVYCLWLLFYQQNICILFLINQQKVCLLSVIIKPSTGVLFNASDYYGIKSSLLIIPDYYASTGVCLLSLIILLPLIITLQPKIYLLSMIIML